MKNCLQNARYKNKDNHSINPPFLSSNLNFVTFSNDIKKVTTFLQVKVSSLQLRDATVKIAEKGREDGFSNQS